MSLQFGRCNTDRKPVDRSYLEKVKPIFAPYGPDEEANYTDAYISIFYKAFHTTKESRHESQPYVTKSGAILTWDGRIDNRADLIRQLRDHLTGGSTDLSIVAAAYDKWGIDCFPKLVGDWALSIWDPESRSLILAKDPIGSRHLYYSIDNEQVSWSTILDPLVLFAGHSFVLSEEYIAGWFSYFPAVHLTPYVGIHSVPPSSFALIRNGKHLVRKYWDFDPTKRIHYRCDTQYEEHFREVLAEAVRRRLRSDSPILAELSGGMDSSSIVCMADAIIARGSAETPRLDTISYYDDCEPNWNERPYFAKVEEKRGRTGTHIDVGKQEPLNFLTDSDHFRATPASGGGRSSQTSRQIVACMTSHANRVVLSGIGGDEFTGGVPTPVPEFQDLLARGHFRTLAHQLKVWALNQRRPWIHLILDAIRGFFPLALVGVPKYKRPAAWLNTDFVRRNRAALTGYETRTKVFGSLPSFQANVATLEVLRRQLACAGLSSELPREKRYPFLDRNLLEFVFAIPREQLVRPGQRRSLLRRAMTGVVPDDILNRKRKAFVVRSAMSALASDWEGLTETSQGMVSGSLGIVEEKSISKTLQKVRRGDEVAVVTLMRTLGIELWLRGLRGLAILETSEGHYFQIASANAADESAVLHASSCRPAFSQLRTMPKKKGGEP
jgi:asparagine synthase (glutamine-hydrolysing)